ncbi:HEAT repeat domain-containing protein [Maioricimonas sp. JC845]|uniref:HEAT repeat domain-containing protein n=1 Tax=Maioricimonas sp. JC845 TaxID=3232138 RepID=UPI00345776A2
MSGNSAWFLSMGIVMRRLHIVLAMTVPVMVVASLRTANADVITLHGGGVVRGKLSEHAGEGRVEMETLTGGRVILEESLVEDLQIRSLLVEEYATRARTVAPTAEAHWELAEWCRDNGLKAQRTEQLELVVEFDPGHEKAHRGLGHVAHDGEWMTRDEAMAARGYIKYQGKYVTQQELDLLQKSQAERDAEIAWFPKVRLWFRWATGRNAERRRQGLANLQAIDDPDAVPALANVMAEHEEAKVRLAFVKLLGGMPGEKPVPFLVELSLLDEDPEIRFEALKRISPSQAEAALPLYVAGLEHDDNDVICRAADALGMLGDSRVVPNLIDALVTEHRYKVRVPVKSGMSFGTTPSGDVGMIAPGSTYGTLPPNVEGLLRTGQLPYGVQVQSPMKPQRYRTITVKKEHRNREVLAALQKITSEDFGYSRRDWQVWWAAEQQGLGQTS